MWLSEDIGGGVEGHSGYMVDFGLYGLDEVLGSRKGVRVWVLVKGGLERSLLPCWGSSASCI